MEITLPRVYLESETLGSMYLPDGTLLCKTLELPWKDNQHNISCIYEGNHIVIKEAPKPGREYWHFRLPFVDGRSGILIHPMTYFWHSEGCLGVGSRFVDLNKDNIPDIVESKKKLQYMVDTLPDRFYLHIMKKL